ncbi:MAG: hypothetical protein ABI650_10055 [Dokdonella sp.]
MLNADDRTAQNIVKLTTIIVHGNDGQAVRNARLKDLGDQRAASTTVLVPVLMDPRWLEALEAIAAKGHGLIIQCSRRLEGGLLFTTIMTTLVPSSTQERRESA